MAINPLIRLFNIKGGEVITDNVEEITQKEHEVIWLLLQGYSRKEVSCILNISSRVVNNRLHSVFEKKNIFNLKQLRELYISKGLDMYVPSSLLKNGVHFL